MGMWLHVLYIYTAMALGRSRMASTTRDRIYPGKSTCYSFYRRLSGPEDQSGYEGVKKNLHPSEARDRTRTMQPVGKRLAAWATWPTPCVGKSVINKHFRSSTFLHVPILLLPVKIAKSEVVSFGNKPFACEKGCPYCHCTTWDCPVNTNSTRDVFSLWQNSLETQLNSNKMA